MNSDESLAKIALKGFDAKIKLQMVANVKKALLEFLKINDDQQVQSLMGPIMMLAPIFMI